MNKIKATGEQLEALGTQLVNIAAVAAVVAILEDLTGKTPGMNKLMDDANTLLDKIHKNIEGMVEVSDE